MSPIQSIGSVTIFLPPKSSYLISTGPPGTPQALILPLATISGA